MLRKIKQSLGLSLDKAGGYAIIKTKGHCYSSQALIVQSISIDDRFGYQPDGHRAFIQKMYSNTAAHTKSLNAFFCIRATSFLPQTAGKEKRV